MQRLELPLSKATWSKSHHIDHRSLPHQNALYESDSEVNKRGNGIESFQIVVRAKAKETVLGTLFQLNLNGFFPTGQIVNAYMVLSPT